MKSPRSTRLAAALCVVTLVVACAMQPRESAERHRWWSGLGPVLPHDSFPADCTLCHVAENWNTLKPGFEFDHLTETGVPLVGAHSSAQCLRCHNDRGPVETFWAQGCQGCHEDVHLGELGPRCTNCHQQETWVPENQFAYHYRTRFPLVGAHAQTACRRCHPGALVGRFQPVGVACVGCHAQDLARTTNHVGLGWVDRCDRCHTPTLWQQAEID